MPDSRLAEAVEPTSAAMRHSRRGSAGCIRRRAGQGWTGASSTARTRLSCLGVGKNMVNAMRYWSKAFKLTQEHAHGDPSTGARLAAPTWRARWLLDENGADPYLEDTGSLWLLHWWLLSART